MGRVRRRMKKMIKRKKQANDINVYLKEDFLPLLCVLFPSRCYLQLIPIRNAH